MKKALLLFVFMCMSTFVFAQQTYKGVVRDDSGEPVAGAYILIKGTTNGVTSENDGSFEITGKKGAVLEITYFGLKNTEIVLGDTPKIDVVMATDIETLNDVVVVGYGVTEKRHLSGSIAQIKADDVKAGIVTNTAEMLRGRAAGVMVRQQSFEPGGGITVRVRGASSISANNDPLYVVDGIQTSVGNQVSPEDIESIEILKDASATAIYGARGANGVVLITTKKGRSGKISIDYAFDVSSKTLYNPWKLMNAQDVINYNMNRWEENGAAGDPPYTEKQREYKGDGTDWIKAVTRNALTKTHAISVSGGNDKVRAAATFINTDDEGIVLNSSFHRLSGRINTDFFITKWLRAGVNAYIANTKKTYISMGTNASTDNAMYWMFMASPLKTMDGKNVFGEEAQPETVYFELTNKDFNTTVRNSYITSYVEADILKNLTARVQYSISQDIDKYQKYYNRNTIQGAANKGIGTVEVEDIDYRQFEAYMTYNPTFGKHNIKITAGTSYLSNIYNYTGMGAHDFNTDAFSYNNMGAANIIDWIATARSDKNNLSYFGRAEYVFDSKYILNATFRADGASNFGRNNKWGYFPSFSAAWQIGSEKFMSFTKPYFDDIKLRVSWGKSGNDGIGTYKSLRTYAFQDVYLGGNSVVKGMYPQNAGNSELKWETTTQLNLGVDFSMFKNKVEVNFDWYNKHTTDLLNPINISTSTSGLSTTTGNNGSVQNRGVELFVKYHVFDTRDFSWTTTFNMAHNRNKVLSLDTDTYYRVRPHGSYDYIVYSVLQKGQSLSSIYGYVWDGIIQEGETYEPQPKSKPGDPKFVDVDKSGTIDENDRVVLGKGEPDFTFGWGNNFTYKNFDFSFFFDASLGNSLLNLTKIVLEDNDRLASCSDRWTRKNPSNSMIGGTWKKDGGLQYGNFVNSHYVEDASFIRLSNIELGYNLNTKALKLNFIKNLRVFVGGQRLFTITKFSGFDPEVSANGSSAVTQGLAFNSYPAYRQFNAGVKVTF